MSDAIKDRFYAMIGPGWQKDLAEALGMTAPRLSDQFRQDRVSTEVISALEWLEAIPPEQWPLRWHKIRDRAAARQEKRASKAA